MAAGPRTEVLLSREEIAATVDRLAVEGGAGYNRYMRGGADTYRGTKTHQRTRLHPLVRSIYFPYR